MLNELAEDMRKVALENPLDIVSLNNAFGKPFGPTRREVEVDGLPLVITLTYDVLSKEKSAWHLSFSHRAHEKLPEDLQRRIMGAFLLDNGQGAHEMPSMWGPNVRMFIQLVK